MQQIEPVTPKTDYLTPVWPLTGKLQVCTTLRSGGCSQANYAAADGRGGFNLATHVGDAEAHVMINRQRLSSHLPAMPWWLEQTHSTCVIDIDNLPKASASHRPLSADGALTSQTDQVLVVLTADCLPIVIAEAQARVFAVVHAGWRGLADGIVDQALAQLQHKAQALGLLAPQWLAWLGPAIGPTHFEVGDDMRQRCLTALPTFSTAFVALPGRTGKWWADLPALAKGALHRSGVDAVYLSNACTASDAERFYSYRRHSPTGRMATLAWRPSRDIFGDG